MSFIFIRHLPTAYNQQGVLQGQLDSPILPTDAELAVGIAANRKQLHELEPFGHILCSPLIRTRQTAEAHGYQAQPEPLLKELNFGIYEGQNRQCMLDEIGEQWRNNPASLVLGEPVTDLLQRIRRFFDLYRGQGNILAFAHGSWMRAARAWHEQGSLDAMNHTPIANNALLIIQPEAGYA